MEMLNPQYRWVLYMDPNTLQNSTIPGALHQGFLLILFNDLQSKNYSVSYVYGQNLRLNTNYHAPLVNKNTQITDCRVHAPYNWCNGIKKTQWTTNKTYTYSPKFCNPSKASKMWTTGCRKFICSQHQEHIDVKCCTKGLCTEKIFYFSFLIQDSIVLRKYVTFQMSDSAKTKKCIIFDSFLLLVYIS